MHLKSTCSALLLLIISIKAFSAGFPHEDKADCELSMRSYGQMICDFLVSFGLLSKAIHGNLLIPNDGSFYALRDIGRGYFITRMILDLAITNHDIARRYYWLYHQTSFGGLNNEMSETYTIPFDRIPLKRFNLGEMADLSAYKDLVFAPLPVLNQAHFQTSDLSTTYVIPVAFSNPEIYQHNDIFDCVNPQTDTTFRQLQLTCWYKNRHKKQKDTRINGKDGGQHTMRKYIPAPAMYPSHILY